MFLANNSGIVVGFLWILDIKDKHMSTTGNTIGGDTVDALDRTKFKTTAQHQLLPFSRLILCMKKNIALLYEQPSQKELL